MKLAFECPTTLLNEIQPLADFDWILTHLVLSDEAYANFYKSSKRFKVLDNSVNENLEPCTLEDIKDASDIVNPDLIVAPDFLGESEKTMESIKEALKLFPKKSVLPVLQGKDPLEALSMAKQLVEMDFSLISVPYDICSSRSDTLNFMAMGRLEVIDTLRLAGINTKIHLLGVTTLEELSLYDKDTRVVSVDTGSPIVNGLRGIKYFRDTLLDKTTSSMDRMSQGDPEDLTTAYYNIAMLRRILN